MRHLLSAAAAAAALTFAPAAQAAVLYTLSGSFQSDVDDDGPLETEVFEWSFSFQTEDFLTTSGEITADSCSVSGTFYLCAPTQLIDLTSSIFGGAIDDTFVSFQTVNADASGGGGAFYFFQGGAFGAYGTYTNEGQPDPGGPTSDGGFVGNAGPATLVVSAVSPVPEPATWAMMIAGFGLAGGAMRMRRRDTLLASV